MSELNPSNTEDTSSLSDAGASRDAVASRDAGEVRSKLGRKRFDVPRDRVPVKETGENAFSLSPRESSRPSVSDYLSVKTSLHSRLLDLLNQPQFLVASDELLEQTVEDFVADVLENEDLPLNETERRQLAEDLMEETLGVGPLAPLLGDPAVTDVLVNRYDQVYVERFGRLEVTDVQFRNAEHLTRIIQRIAARVGRRIDESSPMVDARLTDGSRVNATLPPVTIDGPTLSIRRFGKRRLRREDLQRLGMFSDPVRQFMQWMVIARSNIIVSGGTGAGKSTFLGAVCEAIPDHERIVTIEDAAELLLDQVHVVRMETRPRNLEGTGQITARDLLVNSLRMRPDRIIVGEVRSGEALDMLQAMNTGHDGSLTTVHANSPRDAVSRLETMVLMAGVELPQRAIREQIASAVDFIISVRRYDDGVRRVESIAEITGMEESMPQMQEIFVFRQTGRQERRIVGEFVATGIVPRRVHQLRERGFDIPLEMFRSGTNASDAAGA
ncbi:CpaF family protein [Rhodopirellula sp. MGV]|uniref:CpaF family protein n=1 Tax=Rhodopirellula sp. MGV TaxID=2023130 RepID=UPI000B95F951|nr:CpaF family protein [Rhodopirellula sp. MGV]OYP32320.1 pilus assembly protein CpaF [Rhodopirellula sp. MGV]PNY35896.1 CpaF family protein [Rhodopirellula baltica]